MQPMNSLRQQRVNVLDQWLDQLGELETPTTREERLANAAHQIANATQPGQFTSVATVMDTPTGPGGEEQNEDPSDDSPWGWISRQPPSMLQGRMAGMGA